MLHSECSRLDVVRVHANLVIARTQVKLGEETGAAEFQKFTTGMGNLALIVFSLRAW